MKTFNEEISDRIKPQDVHEALGCFIQDNVYGQVTNEQIQDILQYTLEWCTGGVVKNQKTFTEDLDSFIINILEPTE